jgi:hypothetical protein
MRFLIILSICFLLSTCTKLGENIYVKGKVINPATGKGIPGVEIALQKKTTFEYATGYKPIEIVKTDANGEFEIRHLGGFKQYYLNCMYSTAYHPIGWYINGEFINSYLTKVKKGKKNEADFQILPLAKYKYSIKNTNCFDEHDFLIINHSHQFDESKTTTSGPYMGCFTYSGSTYVEFPAGWMYYSGYYIKNGITTNFKDSLLIEEGKNNEWFFEY